MSWCNLHKWVVRYSDTKSPNFQDLMRYAKYESMTAQTDKGNTVLHLAITGEYSTTALFILSNYKMLVNLNNDQDESPLHWACHVGNITVVERLLKAGAKADFVDTDGCTALHYAAKAGHLKVIKLLIKKCNLQINQKNLNGLTALGVACEEREFTAIRLLVSYGARVSDVLEYYIIEDPDKDVVKALVKYSNPEVLVDSNGNNPLHCAVTNNNYKIAKMLFSFLSSWATEKNRSGVAPVDLMKAAESVDDRFSLLQSSK